MLQQYIFLIFMFFFGLKIQAVPLQLEPDYEINNVGEDNMDYDLKHPDYHYPESFDNSYVTKVTPEDYSDYNAQNLINIPSASQKQNKLKTKDYADTTGTKSDIYKNNKYINDDYDHNSKLSPSENYPDDVSQVNVLKANRKKILKDKEDENVNETCFTSSKATRRFLTNSNSNVSSLLSEEDLKVSGKSKSKRKIKVYTGEDVTLCWIETITYKEDKSVINLPNRQVYREFSISFENSVGIPDKYLTCPKIESNEILDDTTEICNTSFTQGINRNTRKSKVVKLQNVSHQGNIWITEEKIIRCAVGSVVTKDVLSTLDDFENPIKRIEIKISPSTYNAHEYCNILQENQYNNHNENHNIQINHDKKNNKPCLGKDCFNTNTESSTAQFSQQLNESENDQVLLTGVSHNPLTALITNANNTPSSTDNESNINNLSSSSSLSDCGNLSQINNNNNNSRLNCSINNTVSKTSLEEHSNESSEDNLFAFTTTQKSLAGLLRKPQVPIKSGDHNFLNISNEKITGTTIKSEENEISHISKTTLNIEIFSTSSDGLILSLNNSSIQSPISENNLLDKKELKPNEEIKINNKTENVSGDCTNSTEKIDSSESLKCSIDGVNCNELSLQSTTEKTFNSFTEENNIDLKDFNNISKSEVEDCKNNSDSELSNKKSNQVEQEDKEHDNNTQSILSLNTDNPLTSTLNPNEIQQLTKSNGKPKLALKIKLSLEHIGEDKEQRKLADIEKNLNLAGNPNDQGNNILLQHLQALNNTGDNFDSIKKIFNCSILDKISENVIGRRNNRRKAIKSLEKAKVVNGEIENIQNRDKRSLDVEIDAEKKSTLVKSEKIKKCLSEIHEDIKTGLNTLLSDISGLYNNSTNSTVDENQLDSMTFSNSSTNLNDTKINERIVRSIDETGMRELSRWSKRRFINLDEGDQLYTNTELIIFNNSEDF